MVLSHRRRTGNGKLKWTLLRGKRASVMAAALPTVSAFVVVATVIVAVGVMLSSTGRIFARYDKEHGEKKPFGPAPRRLCSSTLHPHIGIRLPDLTREPRFPFVKMNL